VQTVQLILGISNSSLNGGLEPNISPLNLLKTSFVKILFIIHPMRSMSTEDNGLSLTEQRETRERRGSI
jgi:hypothetical protein